MKNGIHSLVFCCLIAVGAVRVVAATATAQSGNCTVNTSKLTLEASSETDGVKLDWGPLIPSAVYILSRDGVQIHRFAAPNKNFSSESKYIITDTGAIYGKVHTYKVTTTVQGVTYSATAEGTRGGTGLAPKIVSVEAAELWLENESYNIRIVLNDYDASLYKIEKIRCSVNGKEVSCAFPSSATGSLIVDLYAGGSGLKKGVKHGANEVVAWLEYEDVQGKKKGLKTDKTDKDAKCVAKCYFHKYGESSGKPNWFECWPEDGAIPQTPKFVYGGSSADLGAYKHSSTVSYSVSGRGNDYFVTSDGIRRKFPKIVKHTELTGTFYLYADAASKHSSIVLKDKTSIGKDAYGVRACQVVRSHEIRHRTTAKELSDAQKGHYDTVSISDTDLDALKQSVQAPLCADSVKEYYKVLCEALKETVPAESFDKDGDGVLDSKEEFYNSKMRGVAKGDNPDSFKIGELDWSSSTTKKRYKDAGDNEYISRTTESPESATESKDWAFPGYNLLSTRGEHYEGMDEKTWNKKENRERLTRELTNSFGSRRGVSLQTRLSLEGAQPSLEEESDILCERISSLPDLTLDNLTKDVEIADVTLGTATGVEGAYQKLSFEIQIATKEDVTNNITVTGWLVDSDAHPVAKAQTYVSSLNGVKTVVLSFTGSDIYIKGGQGYALKYLTLVSDVINGEQEVFDAKVDAAITDRTYRAPEFAPKSGYLMSFGSVLEENSDDLNISVPIEICSNGVYELSAVLKAENGESVAEAFATNITQFGQQEICLAFSKKDIFLSKQNGPYILRKIELRREDGACVDSVWDAYTTAAYSYRDFADGSETIFADEASFRREPDLVGADGLCDALNFSFSVENLAPTDAEWTARIYLCGTNDELVCSSARNVVLSNDINRVTVPFQGLDIKERGVEGPYFVSEVAIENAETGEVVERFKPEPMLVDRRLDEFGTAPATMNGAAALAEGTEANPFVVQVPVLANRPGIVTASAVLVSTNGTPVAYAEESRDFAAGETGVLTLSFSGEAIVASCVRGPYYIQFIAIRSGYEGLDPVQVDDPRLGELHRQFVLYVDGSMPDDSGDGLSPATAKATIRGALAVAQPSDLVLVADGVYEPFECYVENVSIRSVNGPEKTIIDGEGQMRCAYFERDWWEDFYNEEDDAWDRVYHEVSCGEIEGFTLRNGWTRYDGGGISGGTARRCIITGCKSDGYGGGAYYATLENCIVCGNHASRKGGGVYMGKIYNCTVSGNEAASGVGGVYATPVYNGIVWGNRDGVGDVSNYCDESIPDYDSYDEETGEYSVWFKTEFHASCTFPLPEEGEGNIDSDPMLADAAHGDVRLRSSSPCIDAGSETWVTFETDIYGRSRIQGSAPEMGAVENLFEDRICVSASVRGVGLVSPLSAFAEEGDAVLFTATEIGREFLRFETNGAYASSSPTLSIWNMQEPVEVVAVFKPGNLYVRTDGADGSDGLSWATAKATIQGALDDAADGDVVYVGEGVYAPFDSNNRPVTIRSVGGAAQTVIDAGGAGTCAYMGGYNSGENNTLLVGFTLRNGHVLTCGAGASGGTLVDCRIENNRCHEFGGGLYRSVARRCVVVRNTVEYDPTLEAWGGIGGGGAYDCELESCLIVSNSVICGPADSGCGGGGTMYCSLFNCTVADNRLEPTEAGLGPNEVRLCGGGIYFGGANNTICWGNSITGIVSNAEYAYGSMLWTDVDPLFAGEGQYTLSPDSPCIDAGDNDDVRGIMDLAGNARISGPTVDMGAYEHAEEAPKPYYTVHFNPNGGEGTMDPINVVYGMVTNLPANAFCNAGKWFLGWAVDLDGEVVFGDGASIVNLTESATLTLYAQWTGDAYFVTFDGTGNAAAAPLPENTPEDGLYYALPTDIPTRGGYKFIGWALADGTILKSFAQLSKETTRITLHATWAPCYSIAFDANGGNGEMSPVAAAGDEAIALPSCAFTRPGFAFVGWTTMPDGNVRYIDGTTVSNLSAIPNSTVTLYAAWADKAGTTLVRGAGNTLQLAMAAVPDGGLVLVYPGVYEPIDATGRALEIRAVFGPDSDAPCAAQTVIDGGGAARCATLGEGVVLSGFVLRNGGADFGGGALGGTLENCRIEDCAATVSGGGACGSTLSRCTVSFCSSDGNGGGLYEGSAENTVVENCDAALFGGGAYHATLTGCTVYGCGATAGAGVAGCQVANSIVWENRLYETDKKGVRKLGNCANVTEGKKTLIKNTCTYTDSSPKPAGAGNLAKDPLFVDADSGDFRLQWASPVKNKAGAKLAAGDFDLGGLPRVVGDAPDMGAHEIADGTPVPADYDGDGVTDAAYFDVFTATWIVMQSRDGLRCVRFGDAKATPVPADYDGDGLADLATYSATAKTPLFRILTQAGDESAYVLGEKGATPFATDVDGDGRADPCVFQGNAKKPSFTALLSGNGHDAAKAFGLAFGTKGAKPVAGDFDGDGRVDFGCYTATASKPVFNVALSGRGWNAASPLAVALGAKGSEPCCGDFDGDGIADFAVYNGAAKTPLLYRMFSTAKWREVRTLPFGQKGSRATTADWDGDGAADAAIEFQGAWWRVTRDWDVREIPAP